MPQPTVISTSPGAIHRTDRARVQRGLSSVLFLMLTGLSLGAIVFGAIYYVRGFQSQSVTVHAATQSQLKAWTGVEALRQYLYQLGATEAGKFTVNQTVNFGTVSGVSARVSSVTVNDSTYCGGGTRLGFDITGSSGGGNSLLGAMFCVMGSAGTPGSSTEAAMNLKGNVDLGGNMEVISNDKTRVLVDGSISGSGSLSGINYLYATGNVTLGGATAFDNLYSEGNINLSGSGSYTTVSSMKDVTLSGSVQVGTLTANGKATLNSNMVTDLNAVGDVVLNAAPYVTNLKTKGSVTASNAVIGNNALVQLNYTESSNGLVASGSYGGTLNKPSWNNQFQMTRVPGLQVSVTPMSSQAVTAPTFDAMPYKAVANYVIERSGASTKITVKDVNTIPDGVYFLAGTGANQDWLCTTANYSAGTCLAKICTGWSAFNSCLSYNAGSGTWTIDGSSMAPGVVWVSGNLVAASGTYFNSFIVSGNISTGGNNITYAVNYAGYSAVCNNSIYPNLYPKNFCKAGKSDLQYLPYGNIAFGAGSKVGTTYVGGKVDLTAANHVYGSVLAGDILSTGGNTVIHGFVSAADMGVNTGNNTIGANTKIDLTFLPAGFKPGDTGAVAATSFSATLLWTRYR